MAEGGVLVAGGTGFIGSHLATRLQREGYRVSVLSRRPEAAAAKLDPAIARVRGDVQNFKSLVSALRDVDILVGAVQFPGAPVEKPRYGHTYMRVDGQGTVNLVAAAKTAGVKRLVYISGAGTREGQTAPWFRAKLLAETAVRDSGIPATIFRPSWVYGPEDRSLNQFATFARRLPFVPVIGSGQTRVQPLHVDDLAEAVARALAEPGAAGKAYDLGGPASLSMDEIIQAMLAAMGRSRPLLHVPAGLIKAAVAPLTLLPSPPLTPNAVDFILMEEPVDNGPAQRDLGFAPRPLAGGLSYLRSAG